MAEESMPVLDALRRGEEPEDRVDVGSRPVHATAF
jgi:hypothetical protein